MKFEERLDSIKQGGKRVLVVGMGVSGVESAKFLVKRGIQAVLCERQSEQSFQSRSKYVDAIEDLRKHGVALYFEIDGERVAPLLRADEKECGKGEIALAVLSPGVSLESSIVGTLTRNNIPYVSELELGVELHGGRSIVVTGSNGKSTTVSLIDHIFRRAGVQTYLCGNVGTPVIANGEIGGGAPKSLLVVEASSYQLEACTVLKPAISVILNISENHLERHGSIERYTAAKARVSRLQDSGDLVILNADDAMVRTLGQGCRAKAAYFGMRATSELEKLSDTWAAIEHRRGSAPRVKLKVQAIEEEYDLSNSPLLGVHNAYNIAAALLVVRKSGVSQEDAAEAIATFAPLEHRLEKIVDDGTRKVFNDSKSTTVAATLAALTTIRDYYSSEKIVLLIGGLSKAGSWAPLLKTVASGAGNTQVICFGKDGPLLASHCREHNVPCAVSATMRDATLEALHATGQGGVVLLSPGCASFDEFRDFEQRGEEFKRYVYSALGGIPVTAS